MADNDAAGSSAGLDAGDHAAADAKIDVARDGTPSSMESTPEADGGNEVQEPAAQPQKRKGGRKPIYATSEERKQRNRQAQAAFRERRTEYIKQLEATIKQNEDTLGTLQQSHRSAADECLMLRYKNSLLERILLEKGIDVQTELQMKTGSPAFPPGFMQQLTGMAQMQSSQPPLQRAAIQRQHARRSGQALTPKLAQGQSDLGFHATSPQAGPTPSSHVSSPSNLSTRSPIALQTGAMTPPTSGVLGQAHGHSSQFSRSQQSSLNPVMYQPPQHASSLQRSQRPGQFQSSGSKLPNHSQPNGQHQKPPGSSGSGVNGTASSVTSASAYYPSPFQKHIDQLEQEYDTTNTSHSMLDQHDADPDQASDPDNLDAHNLHGNYNSQQYDSAHPTPGQGFGYQQSAQSTQSAQMPPPGQQQMTPQYEQQQQQQQHLSQGHQQQGSESESGAYASIPHMIDPNDPMLDADPFGLSASMHYPTSYSFDQGAGGR